MLTGLGLIRKSQFTPMLLPLILYRSHLSSGGQQYPLWSDKWLFGCCLHELALTVVAAVPMRLHFKQTVAEAVSNHSWTADIQGGMSLVGLSEYFQLWDALQEVMLSDDKDTHIWRFTASRTFSSRSAYRGFFNGSTAFEPWCRLWK